MDRGSYEEVVGFQIERKCRELEDGAAIHFLLLVVCSLFGNLAVQTHLQMAHAPESCGQQHLQSFNVNLKVLKTHELVHATECT